MGAFGLSIRTTERDLEEEFGRAGPVDKVVIVYDARTGRSRCFGFITMKDVETATEAIRLLNGIELQGRRIRVDYSSTSRAHDPTPGEYRGNPRPSDSRGPRGAGGPRGAFDRRERDYPRRDYGRGYGSAATGGDSYVPAYRRERDAASRWGAGPDSADWRRREPPASRPRSRSPPRYRDGGRGYGGDRYAPRDSRYDDRYGGRYGDRYGDSYGDRYDRYSDRYGDRYAPRDGDDRYAPRDDREAEDRYAEDRYADDRYDDRDADDRYAEGAAPAEKEY